MDAFSEPKWEPVSIEAEQALIGCILVNNEAHQYVRDVVTPDDFYEPVHQVIYQVVETLMINGQLADWKTIISKLPDIDVAGMKMRQYLARLATEATTIINARDYAIVIRDLSKRRALMDVGARMSEMKPGSALEIATGAIEEIDAMVADLSNSHTRGLSAAGVMAATIDAMARAFQANGVLLGLPTGLAKLDRKTLGMAPGELIIIGGRPGMGKSALMTSLTLNMTRAGHRGILFSQEMSEEQLGYRMAADHLFNTGPVTYFNLRGVREENTFMRAKDAAEELAKLPFRVEPKPFQSAAEIATRVRQAKRKDGLDFWFVDHLNIMNHPGKGMTRNDQIGMSTSALKTLAKETDTVGIVLCQLNRGVEQRDNKRPTLGDLRDSGNIEQDADSVWMLYREAYYLERREPIAGTPEHAAWQTSMLRAHNRLEIAVEKQRSGPTGTIEVFCNIACNAVRDLDDSSMEAQPASTFNDSPPEDDPRFL